MAVQDDDADGLRRINRVFAELWITIDGAILVNSNAVVHWRDRRDLDLVNDPAHTRRVFDQTESGVLIDGLDNRSADRHHTVVNLQRKAVERIRVVPLPVIDQLLGKLLREFSIRDVASAGHGDVIANAGGLVHLPDAVLRIIFVREALHLACEVHDAVAHLYLDTTEFLIAQLLLSVSLYLRV